MDQETHKRAGQYIADAMMGTLGTADQRWLDSHLSECRECGAAAAGMRDAIAALRSAPVHAEAALVNATRRSVRLYAERLREAESHMRMMAVSSALAAVVGAVSLPYVLRGFLWLGGFADLPQSALYVAVVAAWLVPGVVAALALARRPQVHMAAAEHDSRRTL